MPWQTIQAGSNHRASCTPLSRPYCWKAQIVAISTNYVYSLKLHTDTASCNCSLIFTNKYGFLSAT